MEKECLDLFIEFIELYNSSTMDEYAKTKAFKSLLKQAVDVSKNYGTQTAQDLKNIVDLAPNARIVVESISSYLCTHDIRK